MDDRYYIWRQRQDTMTRWVIYIGVFNDGWLWRYPIKFCMGRDEFNNSWSVLYRRLQPIFAQLQLNGRIKLSSKAIIAAGPIKGFSI
tara:strand:+ start:592 stop:852 length:261 start_codon:yes stop_codon:yes gene_type:complete